VRRGLAQSYVLQDGAGRLIGDASLDRFAVEAARAAMRHGARHRARDARVVQIRLAIEEKFEPVLEESQELLVRFAPQVAAMV